VESTKSVSDIFAPVSGEVIEINAKLSATPETINQDPYLNGWMVKVALDQSIDSFELLTAEEYIALSEG
jgi:glycine cleavage system H protein